MEDFMPDLLQTFVKKQKDRFRVIDLIGSNSANRVVTVARGGASHYWAMMSPGAIPGVPLLYWRRTITTTQFAPEAEDIPMTPPSNRASEPLQELILMPSSGDTPAKSISYRGEATPRSFACLRHWLLRLFFDSNTHVLGTATGTQYAGLMAKSQKLSRSHLTATGPPCKHVISGFDLLTCIYAAIGDYIASQDSFHPDMVVSPPKLLDYWRPV
ncbi:hypothetical protein EDB85DRAFT_1894937 [Lactarius pseudohatsudake]|nr:hypothetical protein EDB85DRAFT_1894937 [Lactarius pseudohatsudake]